MEIEGTIFKVLPERTGESGFDGRQWRVASYIIETTEGGWPKKICFDVVDGANGRIDRLNIQEGKKMKVWLDIDAHEYQGRWFNQIRCYDARDVEENLIVKMTE